MNTTYWVRVPRPVYKLLMRVGLAGTVEEARVPGEMKIDITPAQQSAELLARWVDSIDKRMGF